jgi:hypothetical protein
MKLIFGNTGEMKIIFDATDKVEISFSAPVKHDNGFIDSSVKDKDLYLKRMQMVESVVTNDDKIFLDEREISIIDYFYLKYGSLDKMSDYQFNMMLNKLKK